jgi:Zn-dependent M28 family amino/carboxypeptidase
MVLEAARLLQSLKLTPRRTIRTILFTNEENGVRGAIAYYEKHKTERHVAAIEADEGAGAPYGFTVEGSPPEELAALKGFAAHFAPLGANTMVKGFSGVDLMPMTAAGILGVGLWPDTSHYFDVHHSPADTAEKIHPAHLQKNAAALALMAWLLAER